MVSEMADKGVKVSDDETNEKAWLGMLAMTLLAGPE